MAGAAGKLVGIDLGTTFSAIATLDDHGQPVTLPNRDGDMLAPSAVFLDALVIRSILLPAVLQLLGHRTWAFPSWADRILPRFAMEAPEHAPETAAIEPA